MEKRERCIEGIKVTGKEEFNKSEGGNLGKLEKREDKWDPEKEDFGDGY